MCLSRSLSTKSTISGGVFTCCADDFGLIVESVCSLPPLKRTESWWCLPPASSMRVASSMMWASSRLRSRSGVPGSAPKLVEVDCIAISHLRTASSRMTWSCSRARSPSRALANTRSLSFHSPSSVWATRRLFGSTNMKRSWARSASIWARSIARQRNRSASSCRTSSLRISSVNSTVNGVVCSAIGMPNALSIGGPAIG
ncbi:hypothetical protein ABIB81_009317 [Bradyrhizobium sp. I1.7.5]